LAVICQSLCLKIQAKIAKEKAVIFNGEEV